MQLPEKFNIRVYGFWIKNNAVLCCREKHGHKQYYKFPGGGLNFGEGIVECLHREFVEETGVQLSNTRLFFVNEHYQQSAFNPLDQLISIYFIVESPSEVSGQTVIEYRNGIAWEIESEWRNILELDPQELTFPVDKLALEKLKAHLSSASI